MSESTLAEPNLNSIPSSQPSEEQVDQPSNSTIDNSIDMTNVTLNLPGEQVAVENWSDGTQLYGNDGNVYILVQNEKGEYFISPETENALLNQVEGVQLSSVTAPTDLLANDNPVEVESTEEIHLQKDETQQSIEGIGLAPDNVDMVDAIILNKNDVTVGNLPVLENVSCGELTNCELKTALNVDNSLTTEASKTVDSMPKQSNANEISKAKIPPSTECAVSSIFSSVTSKNISQNLSGSILGNFVANSQLANSLKTYSRPRNIQWITPNLKPNGIDNIDDSIKPKEVLTTTIEIADAVDEFDESPQKHKPELKKENNSENKNEIIINKSPEKVKIDLDECKMDTSVDSVSTNIKINSNADLHNEEKRTNKTVEDISLKKMDIDIENEQNHDDPTDIPESPNINGPSQHVTDQKVSPLKMNDNTDGTSSKKSLRGRRSSLRKESKDAEPLEMKPEANKKRKRKNEPKETKKINDISSVNNHYTQTLKHRKNVSSLDVNDSDEAISEEIDIDVRSKDVRDDMFFNDYKKNDLHIHIRIQPEDRNDQKEAKYFCGCGYESLSLFTNRNHQESCFKNLNSPFLNSNHTPVSNTKLQNKILKFTYKPFDIDFLPCDVTSDDFSDSESGNEECPNLEGFKENDIVWVDSVHELGRWPALIMRILHEERKLSVKLIEYPSKKQNLKIDVKDAVSYNVGIKDKKLKWNNVELTKACSKADEYVRKRTLMNLNDETHDSMNAGKFFKFTKNCGTNMSSVTNNVNGNLGNSTDQLKNKVLSSIQVDNFKIFDFIINGNADSHIIRLCDERHRKSQENNDQFQPSNIFGPIKDEDSQEVLTNYCRKILETYEKDNKISDNKISENSNYVLNVLVPEAITRAISKIYQLDSSTAERIFDPESNKQTAKVESL